MSDAWLLIACLTVATVAIKAAGPLAVGGRELPPRAMAVIALLGPVLLSALVVVETFGAEHRELTVDARAVGLGACAVALLVRAPLIVCVGGAAAAAALFRLVT